MLSNLRDPYNFLFSTLPGKYGKGRKILGIKDDGHLWWCCRILIPFTFVLITHYRQRDLALGIFRNILASKKIIFVNFYIDLHFQDPLLQELDNRHNVIILVNTRWKSVGWFYSSFLLFFQMTHFPPGKWRLSCAPTSIHAAHFYWPRERWSQSAKKKSN